MSSEDDYDAEFAELVQFSLVRYETPVMIDKQEVVRQSQDSSSCSFQSCTNKLLGQSIESIKTTKLERSVHVSNIQISH